MQINSQFPEPGLAGDDAFLDSVLIARATIYHGALIDSSVATVRVLFRHIGALLLNVEDLQDSNTVIELGETIRSWHPENANASSLPELLVRLRALLPYGWCISDFDLPVLTPVSEIYGLGSWSYL